MWITGKFAVASFVVLTMGLSWPAFAHSGGGSGGAGAGAGSGGASAGGAAAGGAGAGAAGGAASGNGMGGHSAQPSCPQGFVYRSGACLHASSGVLPDDDLYRQGRALALAGYYAHALPILEAVARTDDPMVYTMRGFATRKLGHYDAAMRLYDRALALDPDNIDTHEYIGESYVELKRPDLARAELAKVAKLCGPGCEQYDDLAEAIETGRTE